MNPMLGGITGPIVAEEALTVAAKPLGYPFFSIMGTMVEPTAAALAMAAPETIATSILAMTTTYDRPPGKGPIKASARRVSLFVMPAAFMISPANRKNGRANSTNVSAPELICWATTSADMSLISAT